VTTAAITIKNVKRPVSGRPIGQRIVCAHINQARFDVFSQMYVQSFAPKYIIRESGDYPSVTEKALQRFIRQLKEWDKIDKVVWG
jgi:hypothetical protein